jgi:hypothetical protein
VAAEHEKLNAQSGNLCDCNVTLLLKSIHYSNYSSISKCRFEMGKPEP